MNQISIFYIYVFICGFSEKVTCTFLAFEAMEKFAEINTFQAIDKEHILNSKSNQITALWVPL